MSHCKLCSLLFFSKFSPASTFFPNEVKNELKAKTVSNEFWESLSEKFFSTSHVLILVCFFHYCHPHFFWRENWKVIFEMSFFTLLWMLCVFYGWKASKERSIRLLVYVTIVNNDFGIEKNECRRRYVPTRVRDMYAFMLWGENEIVILLIFFERGRRRMRNCRMTSEKIWENYFKKM